MPIRASVHRSITAVIAAALGFSAATLLAGDAPPRLFSADEPLKVFDVAGAEHRLEATNGGRGFVLVFLSPDCPIACKYLPELKWIASVAELKQIEFYGVLADPTISRAQAAQFEKDFQTTFPIVFDARLALAQRLEPTHTPEAFVFSASGELVYRGRIDDRFAVVGTERAAVGRHDLMDAVSALVTERAVETAYAAPVGCRYEALRLEGKNGETTFARHVAPIVFNNCAGCHRAGEVAPFPLTTFEETRKHATQIADATKNRYMPPWKAQAGFGHFADERRLSDDEIEVLAAWADSGAHEGDPHDLPALPKYPEGWQLGEPDLIVKFPQAFNVPADGPDIIRYFALPLPAEATGRDVAAFEFRPGNRRVVHHSITFLDISGIGKRKDAANPVPGYDGFGGPGFPPIGYLGAWVPGARVRRLPDGLGMPLPKGSVAVVMMHYYPSGKPETDQSELGIYFCKTPAKQPVTAIPVTKTELEIPPGESHHRLTHSFTLPVNVTALGVTPHMHYLGREMKVVARVPGASEAMPLVWIKDWDFNWQGEYDFREPIRLPKGTVIEVEAFYDNSTANPRNPNPMPKLVTYGQETTDEMCLCGVHVALDDVKDFAPYAAQLMREFIKIKDGKLVIVPLE